MVDYRGKLVLAPMVRAGELPTRLLALKYGADLVWGPEIIDKKLITCERFENDKLGTVDFLSPGTTKIPGVTNLVFRTYPKMEQDKLIFQMGTANVDLAVQAANVIIKDVSGIDINAGCPKHFSIHAGMGAALLKTPDLLCAILENLVEKVGKPNNKPISVKIRLFPKQEDSLALIERLCQTGISNLTVHCRTQPMRNREYPIRDYIPKIKQITDKHNITLIINGGIQDKSDFIKTIQEVYENGKDIGGMIASTAETNATVFSDPPLPWYEAIKEYIKLAQLVDNFTGNSKYMVLKMTPGKSKLYQPMSQTKTYEDMKKLLESVEEYKDDVMKPVPFMTIERNEDGSEKNPTNGEVDNNDGSNAKRRKGSKRGGKLKKQRIEGTTELKNEGSTVGLETETKPVAAEQTV
ncbi:hypothetical protein WICPIJ_000589 [Wickerhamomyces pijperi]|uniref:DUS-like FMN-binding domain-containing protein n=1 Tax=Wickerhamomyces pijperi TaxID=599730 RepID=A0A9P8QG98_WICPI|nr:hypothetical protein WICPIJ_000589 [Wickerhamomyces pijperi]